MESWTRFELTTIGAALTFQQAGPRLDEILRRGGPRAAAVIQAPPGSGKTTLVPPTMANHIQASAPARVLVTQPRRVATRAAARRLATLDGSRLGERVGYSVRGDRRLDRTAVIEFLTPGLLLRRLLAHPDLPGVGAVVLDEVHERNLETDLLLGMLSEVYQLRDDLALIAMSATVDAPRFARLLGSATAPAPIIDAPIAQFPLTTSYAAPPTPRLDERGVRPDFLTHVSATAATAHRHAVQADPSTDALVFLPGVREVRIVAADLTSRVGANTDVLPLHSSVPAADQDRILQGRAAGGRPRIVVATAIAESSLTVPGVHLVIDSGLAREPRRDSARDMSGLVTVAASRAAMDQRAGRAARTAAGTVIRCIDDQAMAAAPAFARSQLSTMDLTAAALMLACWGTPGGEGLTLPEDPPAGGMDHAHAVLRRLDAIEADGRVTNLGRLLAQLPADPRWARALLEGRTHDPDAGDAPELRSAAEVVSIISGSIRPDRADIPGLVRELRQGRHPHSSSWRHDVKRLLDRVCSLTAIRIPGSENGGHHAGGPTAMPIGTAGTAAAPDAIGRIIARAHPDRIARRVEDRTYQLASGTRATLPVASPLEGQDWLAIAEVTRVADGTGALIRAAAPVTSTSAEQFGGGLMQTSDQVRLTAGRVTVRRNRRIGALTISSTPVPASESQAQQAIETELANDGWEIFHPDAAARAFRRRVAFVHHHLGPPWPALTTEDLRAEIATWLGPELPALAQGGSVYRIDLLAALRRLLPWSVAHQLEHLAPERLPVASGGQIRVDYPADPSQTPVVAVKLQECFGMTTTPAVARVPVVFHLLSPAGRTLAVTDDLASFWAGPYHQVRAENRGRYAKHPWPVDPSSQEPTRRTTARLRGG